MNALQGLFYTQTQDSIKVPILSLAGRVYDNNIHLLSVVVFMLTDRQILHVAV